MAKMKKPPEDDCPYRIHPLGKGLPLCMHDAVKEHKLETTRLRDIPMCKQDGGCKNKEERK